MGARPPAKQPQTTATQVNSAMTAHQGLVAELYCVRTYFNPRWAVPVPWRCAKRIDNCVTRCAPLALASAERVYRRRVRRQGARPHRCRPLRLHRPPSRLRPTQTARRQPRPNPPATTSGHPPHAPSPRCSSSATRSSLRSSLRYAARAWNTQTRARDPRRP